MNKPRCCAKCSPNGRPEGCGCGVARCAMCDLLGFMDDMLFEDLDEVYYHNNRYCGW